MNIFRSLVGIIVLVLVAYIFSQNRKNINWRIVGIGLCAQVIFFLMINYVPFIAYLFDKLGEGFITFLGFSSKGAEFLFGDLAKNSGSSNSVRHQLGFLFAFQVLPTLIFFSCITTGLYYLGILQKIVKGIAWIMQKSMGLSGPESLSAAGNIFLGQTEAPLLVKPFIKHMTHSELMCLMTGGMATLAGGVLAAYVTFLGGDDPVEKMRYASYLLSASFMNAPAAIVTAKILVPEKHHFNDKLELSNDTIGSNLIDALSIGAQDGLKLAVNVGAMLLAFISLLACFNYVLKDIFGELTGLNALVVSSTNNTFDGFSLQYIFGQVFRVLAFIIGVDWKDTLQVGSLLGEKTVINEFVAYISLAEMKTAGSIDPKSILISTYALCGFSNFSSIAIQIGGIGGMAPSRQADVAKLGLLSLLGASLACFLSATIAGGLTFY